MTTINHRDAAATFRAALVREEAVIANPKLYSSERVAKAELRAVALRRFLGISK